jgi:protein arginine kinase activator
VVYEICGEERTERRLCEECAASRGLLPSAAAAEAIRDPENRGADDQHSVMLSPAADSVAPPAAAAAGLTAHGFLRRLEEGTGTAARGRCAGCGCTYAQIRRTGLLGCAVCYTAFHVELEDLLRRIHGALRHQGKAPGAVFPSVGAGESVPSRGAPARRLANLRSQLDAAVKMEAYEVAASLRDRIRVLEETSADSAGSTGGGAVRSVEGDGNPAAGECDGTLDGI